MLVGGLLSLDKSSDGAVLRERDVLLSPLRDAANELVLCSVPVIARRVGVGVQVYKITVLVTHYFHFLHVYTLSVQ